VERALAKTPDAREAMVSLVAAHSARRERERDGWLAVFLEFWTHALRHPEHRARFAAIHGRYIEAFATGMERWVAERDGHLPLDAHRLTVALTVMATGLGLERLTQPDVIDADFTVQVQRLVMDSLLEHAPVTDGDHSRRTP